MEIGKAIAQVRKQHGLSQDELADLCEVSKPTISRIEADKQWPARETLDRIARELDVYLYQLFAIAEDVSLPLAYESEADRKFRGVMEGLDEQTRYLVEAVAAKLGDPKKK